MLSETDIVDLQRKFEALDAEIGGDVHHRLKALARQLQADAAALITA